ncbi:MAG: GHMP kinase [Bacteroidetes bacterium HGW-Bacteroidetes-17]|nr:MAG: GHMP kinase [Bacteroidetes bacterium HGW-Bacteroidetes-17]
MQQEHFYSNGKLLLSSEYLVLYGAKALALPLKLGQDLIVEHIPTFEPKRIRWNSFENNKLWFEMEIGTADFSIQKTSDLKIAKQLLDCLQQAKKLNPDFLKEKQNLEIHTNLDFNKTWGLGSSSTLVNNIAVWAETDPFKLLNLTFGGSGYDIACASADQPIFYQLVEDEISIENAAFDPIFKDNLYFVYTGRKQNTSKSVVEFKKTGIPSSTLISEITQIGEIMAQTSSFDQFNQCIQFHEKLMSSVLKQKPIKLERFSNFDGELKSLGAWGGDFMMASSKADFSWIKAYFHKMGLNIIFKYSDLIK